MTVFSDSAWILQKCQDTKIINSIKRKKTQKPKRLKLIHCIIPWPKKKSLHVRIPLRGFKSEQANDMNIIFWEPDCSLSTTVHQPQHWSHPVIVLCRQSTNTSFKRQHFFLPENYLILSLSRSNSFLWNITLH